MNVANWLSRTARLHRENPALFSGTHRVATYRDLARKSSCLAYALRNTYGLVEGDRVALVMGNCVEYLEVLYGIWIAGCVAVPINAKLHPKEAAWIVSDSGARLVFATPDVSGALGGELSNAAPSVVELVVAGDAAFQRLASGERSEDPYPCSTSDLAWLFYTSGTTGRPKGVMLTHGNLAAMTSCYFMDVDTVSSHDANIYSAPLSHGAGLYHFMQVIRGARHVIPESGKFDAAEVLSLSKSLRETSMFLAPTMVRRLAAEAKAQGGDGGGIKTVVYGGAPMYLNDIEEAMAVMGNRFVQIYGQGESPMTITALSRSCHADRSHPNWRKRLASSGVAQSLVEVRIGGEDGKPCGSGEIGEVLARGPSVMAGYWGQPQPTAATLRYGWLHTGDLGKLDADGFLTLQDRSKDVIISGGSNIYPREVEEVLLRHPAVAEAAVIGEPNAEWGEQVVAFFATLPGAICDTNELDKLCLDNIARFKRPKRYVRLDALPKSSYGKILKSELRLLAAGGDG